MLEFYEEKSGFGSYQRLYSTDGKRVYRFPELHAKEAVILEARDRWRKACETWMDQNGDPGTCVLGNGLYVAVKPPRCRNTYRLCICHPLGQSESPGWATKDAVIEYLRANGIDCWYECGRMD